MKGLLKLSQTVLSIEIYLILSYPLDREIDITMHSDHQLSNPFDLLYGKGSHITDLIFSVVSINSLIASYLNLVSQILNGGIALDDFYFVATITFQL